MKLIKYTALFITVIGSTLIFGGATTLAASLPSDLSAGISHFSVDTTTGTDPTTGANADNQADSQACQALNQLDSSNSCTSGTNDTIKNTSSLVIGILAKIVGVVAVIVIIISGFRFVTSGGDSNTVSSARNTLLYAIVGLVIAILAQFIASDVLNSASKIPSESQGTTTGINTSIIDATDRIG
jgi:hypothetical protein